MYCNATAVLKIDSIYKQGKNYHSHVKECKYTDAENKQCNILSDDDDDDDDDGFFEVNKTSLLELVQKSNMPRRNCMKTKEELEEAIKDTVRRYKEIIFGSNTLTCIVCLDELRKQEVMDQKVYGQRLIDDRIRKLAWEGLQKNVVMDGDMMTDRRTGKLLDPQVDFTYWKDNF